MNIFLHSVTAIPFLYSQNYLAAVGCVASDITWIPNEIRYRLSGIKDWNEWSKNLSPRSVIPYRIVHSFLIVVPLCLWMSWFDFLIGWLIHTVADLFTHKGIMSQMPLYPFKMRWKWNLL